LPKSHFESDTAALTVAPRHQQSRDIMPNRCLMIVWYEASRRYFLDRSTFGDSFAEVGRDGLTAMESALRIPCFLPLSIHRIQILPDNLLPGFMLKDCLKR
jgi:hypothetical protein